MTQAVLIVGNWASGKTELLRFYEERLAHHNIPVVIDSDRLRFEEGVLQDAVERGAYDPVQDIYVGDHSYLTKDGLPGFRHFRVRDGVIPNHAHELMMADIARNAGGPLRLVEFAMGPNVYEFEGKRRVTFYQDGRYVLELLKKYGLLDRVLVIELVAPLEVRLTRQMRRDDNVDMEAFRAFAPDGGELFPHAEILKERYIRFNNVFDDHDAFRQCAAAILREHILPQLRQEGFIVPPEGTIGFAGRWRGGSRESRSPRLVFITGLPASGKSQASREIITLLKSKGFDVRFRTDKEAMEEEVRRDIERFRHDPGRRVDGGGIEGDHSILQNPDGADGTLQMVFKDGNALNGAHKRILKEARDFLSTGKDTDVFVIEWAYGRDVPYPNEELTHTATQLVRWLSEYELLEDVVIMDVVATEADRIERNSRRPGHIPTGEFTLYFPEDGHFTPEDAAMLDGRYRRIRNPGTTQKSYERFLARVRDETKSFLLPALGLSHETREGEPLLLGKKR